MKEFKRRLVILHHCRNIGWKTIFRILKKDPTLDKLFEDKNLSYLPAHIQEKILNEIHFSPIQEQIRQYPLNHIHTITYFDDEYPELLRQTYEPPWVLYGKGNIKLLKREPKLAVVGSRQSSDYGKRAIEAIFPKLIEKGVLLVSGLAAGVDTLTHQTAITSGGETIGIIAGGIFHIYPRANKDLALEMMRNQLVISEYPPNTPPSRWHFPMRNRIISGISRGTLIVEAKQKSGSLITANFAVNEGREVFALPGSIFNPNTVGTNELIQQGAKLIRNADDILDELLY